MERPLPRIEFVDFGRLSCNTNEAFSREWLVTNGLGGYASGTIGLARTRRYHGLLIAAGASPSCRTLLLGDLPTTATYRSRAYPLTSTRWQGGAISPNGHESLQRFHLEEGMPVWRWAISDALIERRVFMVHGENTVAVHWRLVQGDSPVQLKMGVLVDCRSHHATGRAGASVPQLTQVERGVMMRWERASDPRTLVVQSARSVPTPRGEWWRGYALQEDAARGFDAVDDLWHAADLEVVLSPGDAALVTASTAFQPDREPSTLLDAELARQAELVGRSGLDQTRPVLVQLARAADQFVVTRARSTPGSARGTSIIAGYHWFGEWTRDALIALPGLLLTTRRIDEAKSLLSTLADHLRGGLLPNRFPDDREEPTEFNAVDAPLLFIIASARTFDACGDEAWLRTLWEPLEGIVNAYSSGTKHGICVDGADGLVRAGEPGVQLTWMDARVGDRVVTPRHGKPVEINALWFEALTAMARMARAIGKEDRPHATAAARAKTSFGRYWNQRQACCFDVLDGPDGHDPSIRPNQLFASALGDALLPLGQRRAICDLAMSTLWTPQGVRTLSPTDPRYAGLFAGGPAARDGAYHQGTVWPWLYLPLAKTHWSVHGDGRLILEFLFPIANHLREAGLGSMSEVFSGDPPHSPGGCIAQAWSVAALLELSSFFTEQRAQDAEARDGTLRKA
jgi:predicted glycogen debranching enzyme